MAIFIEGREVTEDDVSNHTRVMYVPHHVDNNLQHPDCKVGYISSITDTGIWIRFNSINGEKTNPKDLKWY